MPRRLHQSLEPFSEPTTHVKVSAIWEVQLASRMPIGLGAAPNTLTDGTHPHRVVQGTSGNFASAAVVKPAAISTPK